MNPSDQKHYQLLLKKHANALKRQGLAQRTIEAYERALRRLVTFVNRPPDQLSLSDITDYFDQLVRTHSWSTVKVDRNGLQFFYKHVLQQQWQWVDIVKPPRVRQLPDILTPDEIALIINSTRELRYQTYLLTVYSMGLRLGEALSLQVRDIDAGRHRVHIRQAKGRKDRYVLLPDRTLSALRHYWSTHRNRQWLFPNGKTAEQRLISQRTMDRGGLQKAIKAIVASCGIHKHVTIHTLRHCYGTHLMECGVPLPVIQREMGHECPKTTVKYTQLTEPVSMSGFESINALVNRLAIRLDGQV